MPTTDRDTLHETVGGPVATRATPTSDHATPRIGADPPTGLLRITRLGHALLDVPVQVVAVSRTQAALLVATPVTAGVVPVQVARRLSTAEGTMTVDGPDGTRWTGASVGAWGSGIRVTICAASVADGGRTRATLTDLAALASDVLRLDAAIDDAAGLRELLGTASHDLRNPLSVLRAGLETLTVHGDELPPEQTDRIAELAVKQARRMSSMIDGLLSLHGMADGEELVTLDVRDLVRDAVEAARLSHTLVDLRLAGPLPQEPVTVRGVPDSLARLLTNLVTNAAVHGGGHVWVGLEDLADTVDITVADDGPGMPAVTGLDTGKRSHRSGGHGLGLVIARRIVTSHGGSISHHDRDGGGAVVRVCLPRIRT